MVGSIDHLTTMAQLQEIASEEADSMQLITQDDYRKFIAKKSTVNIENADIEIGKPWRIKTFSPPTDYKAEEFTVWSFPNRGDWATHSGKYRGNWSPYISR